MAPAQAEEATWAGPLSTRGRWIVDAHGDRFKLKSGNWHGASGTYNGSGDINDPATHHAGEKADQVPLGLDRATTATSRWCCGVDGNERWNTSQRTDQWIDDWAFMTNRYKAARRWSRPEPQRCHGHR